MTLIKCYLPKVHGSEHAKHEDKIHRLCYDLVGFYASRLGDLQSYMTQHLDVSSVDLSYDLAKFDSYMMQMKRTKSSHALNKLDHYLDDVLRRKDDFDILTWWKVQGGRYTILQFIARDLLVILVSTI